MYTSTGSPNFAPTVAVATPCWPPPFRRSDGLLHPPCQQRLPTVLLILCAPVWLGLRVERDRVAPDARKIRRRYRGRRRRSRGRVRWYRPRSGVGECSFTAARASSSARTSTSGKSVRRRSEEPRSSGRTVSAGIASLTERTNSRMRWRSLRRSLGCRKAHVHPNGPLAHARPTFSGVKPPPHDGAGEPTLDRPHATACRFAQHISRAPFEQSSAERSDCRA